MWRGKSRSVSAVLLLWAISLSAYAQSAPGGGWISRITDWFKDTFTQYWDALKDWAVDFVVDQIDLVLSVVIEIINAIGVPDWLTQYSLQTVLSSAGPTAAWAISTFQLPAGIALVGLGWVFRLTRKLFTLGQW